MMVFGALASAATAFIGVPLTMVAKAGPPPKAMSMPSAASACIILASPPNELISTSRPCFLKMPASTPMSAGTKANWLGWALPTRSLVSAPAVPQASIRPAAARAIEARFCKRHRPLPLARFGSLLAFVFRLGCGLALAADPSRFRSAGRAFVERHVASDRHAVELARRRGRDEALGDILRDQRRIAILRLAPAAAAAGADDGLGADRHRDVAAAPHGELALARQLQEIAAGLARACRRGCPRAGICRAVASRNSICPRPGCCTRMSMPSPPRNLPAPQESGPQRAALDHHRAFQLDALDRAVAHVALADRDRAGLAVLERPAAPAAALDALHHEAALGLGMGAEEHHGAAEQRVMAGRHAVRHRVGERPDDGVDHGRHDAAPARHRRGEARHHDVAFGDDDLERAERAFVDRIERAGQRLVGDARAGIGARVDRGLALGRAAGQVDGHVAGLDRDLDVDRHLFALEHAVVVDRGRRPRRRRREAATPRCGTSARSRRRSGRSRRAACRGRICRTARRARRPPRRQAAICDFMSPSEDSGKRMLSLMTR